MTLCWEVQAAYPRFAEDPHGQYVPYGELMPFQITFAHYKMVILTQHFWSAMDLRFCQENVFSFYEMDLGWVVPYPPPLSFSFINISVALNWSCFFSFIHLFLLVLTFTW